MQIRTYEGYIENDVFVPSQEVDRPVGRYKVILSYIEKVESEATKREEREVWLSALHQAIDDALDEDFPDLSPRQAMKAPLRIDGV